jgi:predicted enzyme related to lactoylglutathione lyase
VFEIPAGDARRARDFYGGLFGWNWNFQAFDGPVECTCDRRTLQPGPLLAVAAAVRLLAC